MNPVVVIATHCRKQITSRTIEQLQRQSVVPYIVLVVSRHDEFEYYYEKFDGLTVLKHQNEPLGAKWNHASYYAAKSMKADPLIILGSDDLLGAGYIEKACEYMTWNKLDFIGLNRWFLVDEKQGKMYLLEYENKAFPLGGGRAYSQRLLEKLNYTVFDTRKSRLLDDFGWSKAKDSGLAYAMIQKADECGLNIISIKGPWETMNSAEAILKSRSCKIVKEYLDTKFLEQLL